jgi:hypothetical protein
VGSDGGEKPMTWPGGGTGAVPRFNSIHHLLLLRMCHLLLPLSSAL